MHAELVEILRCPHPHCRGFLDLEPLEVRNEVISGRLRCRSCAREFPIEDGVPTLFGSLPDRTSKQAEIDGWKLHRGGRSRTSAAPDQEGGSRERRMGTPAVVAALSWDADGHVPARVNYGHGLTLAVRFTDLALVDRVEVDATEIGHPARLPLRHRLAENALSAGVIARVQSPVDGAALALPFRAISTAGEVLEGSISVLLTRDRPLPEGSRRLLDLPFLEGDYESSEKERRYWRTAAKTLAAVLESLEIQGSERVLDIGAGVGWAARRFAERGCRAVALDLSLESLRDGTDLVNLGAAYFDRVAGDCDELPFEDGAFDVIFGSAVLHHAPSMTRFLRELRRVLSPTGRIVLVNESLRSLTKSEAAALEETAHDELELGINEHCPTYLGYKAACVASGLRSVHQLSEFLDKDAVAEWPQVRRLGLKPSMVHHPVLGRCLEMTWMLFRGGVMNIVASAGTTRPTRLRMADERSSPSADAP